MKKRDLIDWLNTIANEADANDAKHGMNTYLAGCPLCKASGLLTKLRRVLIEAKEQERKPKDRE